MFFNVLTSEWTKLRSTKSFWWNSSLYFILGAGIGLLMAWMVVLDLPSVQTAGTVLTGVNSFGVIMVMILCAMSVTAEYRHNYASVTFTATPQRAVVVLAKATLLVVIVAIQAVLNTVLALLLGKQILGSPYGDAISLTVGSGQRFLWVVPASAAALALMSMGVAMLVRQTAGAVTILMVWYLLLEKIVLLFPKIGEKLNQYGPFTNLQYFQAEIPAGQHVWSHNASIWYFLLWAVAVFAAGLVATIRRDA